MISSVDVAHSYEYSEFALDNSIIFDKENSSSPMGSKNETQNSRYACRHLTQLRQIKKERKKERKNHTNIERKEERKEKSVW